MIYVLDANIIIHYLRGHDAVSKTIRHVITGENILFVPRAVDYEIRRGFDLMSAPKKTLIYNNLFTLIQKFKIVDMDNDIWMCARHIYVSLKRKGFNIGEIDILIAAFCLHRNIPLVTANTKDFENIDGLRIFNWTK